MRSLLNSRFFRIRPTVQLRKWRERPFLSQNPAKVKTRVHFAPFAIRRDDTEGNFKRFLETLEPWLYVQVSESQDWARNSSERFASGAESTKRQEK